jgi:type I restriction enzyme R subunit
MSPKYTEQDFEEHIEAHLLASGYHQNAPEDYDKDLCLITAEVLGFIRETQPKKYERLEKQYGADTASKLCFRLSREIQKRGTLDVLRKGIKDRGVKFQLAYFKPASGMNPEHQKLYQGNRFAVVRQLKYSKKNENSIDMVLFLNGIPIITAELKNSLTGQFVEEAKRQYRKDRDPKGEPLLQFKRCLVHFAVGNEEVFMTTRLQGERTRFLPFNKDTENPVNPNGHQTHYLWEDIWQPDTLLELINNYLHIQKNTEKYYDKNQGLVEREYEVFIFPRYHQLDIVRKLLDAVHQDGVGQNYLVQHSAGSGKSNSIAWLAHQLASFYQKPTDKERLFDSIIVVTDRRVLNRQLQNTIKQFEQTTGVVEKIEKGSAQLKNESPGNRQSYHHHSPAKIPGYLGEYVPAKRPALCCHHRRSPLQPIR